MTGQGRRSRRSRARLAIAVAVLGTALGLGVAPAFADPGNGNGNPNPAGHSDPPGNGNGAAASHTTNGTGGTFGSPTSPQPVLHPGNQNGANANPGPYSSTRNGAPSLNGNGNGAAVGQPCAGCVGKADNKNPPGQFPNGSDPNAGYECDRNNGIGQTNPAHTGCAASPPTPVTPPVPVKPPAVVPSPAATRSAELVNAVSVQRVSLPSLPVPSVSAPSALPFTGSGVLVQVAVALSALGLGGALILLKRLRFRGA